MTAPPDDPPTSERKRDNEENRGVAGSPGIPAAYTYFGQFIDHDLTLDPTSNLKGRPLTDVELTNLVDFRTPRLDLDCLYGRGPSDQPYLYDSDGLRLVEGSPMSGNPRDPHSVDVPRGPNGRALIGDPRNDENRIVAQLQATMIRFHNQMVHRAEKARQAGDPKPQLADIQEQVRHHYQWVIVHDFLPTIIQGDVLESIFPGLTDNPGTTVDTPKFFVPSLRDRAATPDEVLLDRMPVEFSVAAYRFGHSMIRPIYRLNESVQRRQIFAHDRDPAGDLGGMRPIPSDWTLDWQYFIDIGQGHVASLPGDDRVPHATQFSYKIDTSLVNPLAHLSALVATNPPSLPERNLLRGVAFSLPTGEQVADALGLKPLTPEEIRIGKATVESPPEPSTSIGAIASGAFRGRTPLWTYVLAEAWATSWSSHPEIADRNQVPIKLGPVGGHLVAETLAAFLVTDPHSYLHVGSTAAGTQFRPHADLLRNGRFGLAEMILHALGRSS